MADRRYQLIRDRYNELHEIRIGEVKEAVKYLFLVNSGGVVSFLAFLGASGTGWKWQNWAALCCFTFGLIMVGVYKAYAYHVANKHLKVTETALNAFDADKSDDGKDKAFEKYVTDDNKVYNEINSGKILFLGYAIPYSCFGLFIAGCIFAGFGLSGLEHRSTHVVVEDASTIIEGF